MNIDEKSYDDVDLPPLITQREIKARFTKIDLNKLDFSNSISYKRHTKNSTNVVKNDDPTLSKEDGSTIF
jgi:hypothetical protein